MLFAVVRAMCTELPRNKRTCWWGDGRRLKPDKIESVWHNKCIYERKKPTRDTKYDIIYRNEMFKKPRNYPVTSNYSCVQCFWSYNVDTQIHTLDSFPQKTSVVESKICFHGYHFSYSDLRWNVSFLLYLSCGPNGHNPTHLIDNLSFAIPSFGRTWDLSPRTLNSFGTKQCLHGTTDYTQISQPTKALMLTLGDSGCFRSTRRSYPRGDHPACAIPR